MAYNQEKIDTYSAKLESINKKIKTLTAQKKELEKQIKEMEDREIISAVRKCGCKIPTLVDDLTLANILRQNNLTQNDIINLINDLGGHDDEESKISQ